MFKIENIFEEVNALKIYTYIMAYQLIKNLLVELYCTVSTLNLLKKFQKIKIKNTFSYRMKIFRCNFLIYYSKTLFFEYYDLSLVSNAKY